MARKQKWKMPAWMEPYRGHITNAGGNDIEELMNDDDCNLSNNAIRTALIVAVSAQIDLLRILKKEKLIP